MDKYLDRSGPLSDHYFYVVVSQKASGEMYIIQNFSGNPKQQRFLRTKQDAEKMKLGMEYHFPDDKFFILHITADPTYEMMWPDGFQERLDFAKNLHNSGIATS